MVIVSITKLETYWFEKHLKLLLNFMGYIYVKIDYFAGESMSNDKQLNELSNCNVDKGYNDNIVWCSERKKKSIDCPYSFSFGYSFICKNPLYRTNQKPLIINRRFEI